MIRVYVEGGGASESSIKRSKECSSCVDMLGGGAGGEFVEGEG